LARAKSVRREKISELHVCLRGLRARFAEQNLQRALAVTNPIVKRFGVWENQNS